MAAEAPALAAQPRALVLDTNVVLDLLVFCDPRVARLRARLAGGCFDWIATLPMRAELAQVLCYSHLQARLRLHGLRQEQVLERFDAQATLVGVAARAPCVCKDGDDQKFVDLAAARRALLLSKDKALLSLRKSLCALGADVAAAV